jgi:hypothetical protein
MCPDSYLARLDWLEAALDRLERRVSRQEVTLRVNAHLARLAASQ